MPLVLVECVALALVQSDMLAFVVSVALTLLLWDVIAFVMSVAFALVLLDPLDLVGSLGEGPGELGGANLSYDSTLFAYV